MVNPREKIDEITFGKDHMSRLSVAKVETLSAQEQAIASGRELLHPGVSDRVLRLFDGIRAAYHMGALEEIWEIP